MPDLPGCVAVGETVGETEKLIREAIEFHLEGGRTKQAKLYDSDTGGGVVKTP